MDICKPLREQGKRGAPKKDSAQSRRDKRENKPKLSSDEWRRLRNKVGQVTCSKTWEDFALVEADAQGVAATMSAVKVADRLQVFEIYPPPAEHAPMRRCDACGRITPRTLITDAKLYLICEDCRIGPVCPRDTERAISEGLSRKRAVYAELRKLGLIDREIAVLSLQWEGLSVRKIVEWCQGEIKKTQVHRLLKSGKKKLDHRGIVLPTPKQQPKPKQYTVDPSILNLRRDKNAPAPGAALMQ